MMEDVIYALWHQISNLEPKPGSLFHVQHGYAVMGIYALSIPAALFALGAAIPFFVAALLFDVFEHVRRDRT